MPLLLHIALRKTVKNISNVPKHDKTGEN